MTADEYWQRVVACGWLDDVPQHEHSELEQSVRQAFEREPLYAWSALTALHFDSECIEGLDSYFSYKGQLSRLAEASNGVFCPFDIRHEYIGDRIRVSFDLQGKTYTCLTTDYSDYFDIEIFTLINRALQESGEPRRIIELPTVDQCFFLVIVSEASYRQAERLMVVPPPEYFLWRESLSAAEVDEYLAKYYEHLV